MALRAGRRLRIGAATGQAFRQRDESEDSTCEQRLLSPHIFPPFGAGRFTVPFFFAAVAAPLQVVVFGAIAEPPARSATIAFTIAPSLAINVPLTSSSSQ